MPLNLTALDSDPDLCVFVFSEVGADEVEAVGAEGVDAPGEQRGCALRGIDGVAQQAQAGGLDGVRVGFG